MPRSHEGDRPTVRYGRWSVSADPTTPPDPADARPDDTSGTADAPEPTGSGLAAERARRQALVDEIRRAGGTPYPYRFDRTHTVADLRAGWGDLEPGIETDVAVSTAGRIVLLRDSGKLVFATLRDRSGDIQLFISKAVVGDEAFVAVK